METTATYDHKKTLNKIRNLGFVDYLNTGGFVRLVHEYIATEDVYLNFLPENGGFKVSASSFLQTVGDRQNLENEILPYTAYDSEEALFSLLKSTNISIFETL